MYIVIGSWGSLRLSVVNLIFFLKSNLLCIIIVYLLILRMVLVEINFIVEVIMVVYFKFIILLL